MEDKLLSVYVDNKEVYYVKQIIIDEDDTYIAVFDENNLEVAGYTLDINAYIYAIEKAMKIGKGNCVAVYPKEKRYFVNYEFVRSEEFA